MQVSYKIVLSVLLIAFSVPLNMNTISNINQKNVTSLKEAETVYISNSFGKFSTLLGAFFMMFALNSPSTCSEELKVLLPIVSSTLLPLSIIVAYSTLFLTQDYQIWMFVICILTTCVVISGSVLYTFVSNLYTIDNTIFLMDAINYNHVGGLISIVAWIATIPLTSEHFIYYATVLAIWLVATSVAILLFRGAKRSAREEVGLDDQEIYTVYDVSHDVVRHVSHDVVRHVSHDVVRHVSRPNAASETYKWDVIYEHACKEKILIIAFFLNNVFKSFGFPLPFIIQKQNVQLIQQDIYFVFFVVFLFHGCNLAGSFLHLRSQRTVVRGTRLKSIMSITLCRIFCAGSVTIFSSWRVHESLGEQVLYTIAMALLWIVCGWLNSSICLKFEVYPVSFSNVFGYGVHAFAILVGLQASMTLVYLKEFGIF